MILRTNNNFTVVRQIANHLDTDTNYVRAVIRNAYTDAIIDTLDLTDRGSQRFSKNWRIPADPSGEGFYVSIVTSVYTDAGYTTKNSNYGDEENTYLVADKERNIGGGSGGGVSASTIRRIIQEELDKREEDETELEESEVEDVPRWDEILVAIDSIKDVIPKEAEKTDLTPVLSAIKELETNVVSSINDKEVTPETNLTPLVEELNDVVVMTEQLHSEIKNTIDEMQTDLTKSMKGTIYDTLQGSTFNIAASTATMEVPKQRGKEFDISKLSL